MKNTLIKAISVVMVSAFVCNGALIMGNAEQAEEIKKSGNIQTQVDAIQKSHIEYEDYYEANKGITPADKDIELTADHISVKSNDVLILNGFENEKGNIIETPEGSFVEWKVTIDSDKLYEIEFTYYPVTGRGSSIERELTINGKVPFSSASHLQLDRIYGDNGSIVSDKRGNDIRPSQIECPHWTTKSAVDYLGYYSSPFLFRLEKGENIIRLTSSCEKLLLAKITLKKPTQILSYSEVLKQYSEKGYQEIGSSYQFIEAEKAFEKSDPTLYPVGDRTTPATSPYKGSKISLNTIGGVNWKLPGQKITWKINVKKEGLYRIALKERQNFISGSFVSRKLYIDEKIPFSEMNTIEFNYDNKWKNHVLSRKNGEPYLYYLSEGNHTLTLEATLGSMASIIRKAEKSVYNINLVYRKILMITGATPDIYADYNLQKVLPHEMSVLKEESKTLYELSKQLQAAAGSKGSSVSTLERIAYQLNDFYEKPETIPERFATFKDNITALSTWLLSAREQPLQLDGIIVYGSTDKLPEPDVNFFNKLVHELEMFFASFFEDYSSVGNVENNEHALNVWLATGRDQAQVVKSLVDETFTPVEHIPVNIRLVQPGVLLSAVVAGIGPDVSIQMYEGEPMNYALRGAVVNLSQMPEFDNIKKRFHPESFVPFTFNKGVYALPETTSFSMLFYRKDILNELELQIPKTWDDVYDMLPKLQKKHMNFYMPVSAPQTPYAGISSFYTLLFQYGGSVYSENAEMSVMNSEQGISAFRSWTNLYLNYKLPVIADFPNRFRIGEIPIGIQDYSMYNFLSVFAPEIRGLWDFAPVPGVKQKDGSINRTVAASSLGCVIMSHSKRQSEGWSFLKWWTSANTQAKYGREMESIMGAAARYPTANLEAFSQLPWSFNEYKNLSEQWGSIKGVEQIPGSYFTPRHIDNAFRGVVISGGNARETLNDYVKSINEEITAKRQEFGLSIVEKKSSGRNG